MSISFKNSYLHIMSFITSKFHEIILSVSEEFRWQTVLSSIFHFGQHFKFKKGVIRRKKNKSNFLWLCTFCPSLLQSFRKFCWTVSEELLWKTFHFGQISKFKKGVIRREKKLIKLSCEYAYLHGMSFKTTKF